MCPNNGMLPVFGIFNVCTGVDACDCTWRLYRHHKSLLWNLTLGEKSLAASGTRTCISIAPVFSWRLYQLSYPRPPNLTFSLKRCQSKMTSKSVKFENLSPFFSFFPSLSLIIFFSCLSLFVSSLSLLFLLPWYNCTGWLGMKHQLTYLLFIFWLACEGISSKAHSIKNRFVLGLENILLAGMCACTFQSESFIGWEKEGVKFEHACS